MNNYIDRVLLDQITWYPVFIFMTITMADVARVRFLLKIKSMFIFRR